MAHTVPSAHPVTEPRQFLDVRGFTRGLVQRRSWLIGFVILDVLIAEMIITNPNVQDAWQYIWPGINVTVQITIISFVLAIFVGLFTALMRISKSIILYNISTLYVELFRGLPLLVIILIFAFVITPALIDVIGGTDPVVDANGNVVSEGFPGIPFLDDAIQRLVGIPEERVESTALRTRDIDPVARIVFAFAVTYGAFMSEVFRAGIESIGRGQMEAARSLGMSYVQAMRYVVLPQAIRNVLPALANNFILLLKDTSLASVVAVPEISHLTRQYSSNRFRYPEGLTVLSFIYANLTIILSLFVYALESRLQADRRED
ncbi:MAG TPA: amino acid ABC transporter permease [Oceanobacillus sp.]|nr:amino acid ABC transporter permease [Oceanobacillus sp.]